MPLMKGFVHLAGVRQCAALIVVLALSGCSAGITTHDEVRAAELIVDFLSSLQTERGLQIAYDWTDDAYKAEVPFAEFTRVISSIRTKNSGAEVRLGGYETFGSKEMIVIYADSATDNGQLHFKFSLAGTKHKDYYLRYLSVNDEDYAKNGIYRDFKESVIVRGL